MIKIECSDEITRIELAGTAEDITTESIATTSCIYQKLKEVNPKGAKAFKDFYTRAIEDDILFNFDNLEEAVCNLMLGELKGNYYPTVNDFRKARKISFAQLAKAVGITEDEAAKKCLSEDTDDDFKDKVEKYYKVSIG